MLLLFLLARRSVANHSISIGVRLEFTACRESFDAVGGPAGDGLDRERGVGSAYGWENRAVANPEIGDIPASAIGVHNAGCRIKAHPRRAVEMAGVILLGP